MSPEFWERLAVILCNECGRAGEHANWCKEAGLPVPDTRAYWMAIADAIESRGWLLEDMPSSHQGEK